MARAPVVLPHQYTPPPLDERVIVRNPADQPETETNIYGAPTEEVQWGTEVWAGRRDRAPYLRFGEQATITEQRTIWVIREIEAVPPKGRPLDPDCEIVHKGRVYQATGPPVLRGGMGSGRVARYFEIHTVVRT